MQMYCKSGNFASFLGKGLSRRSVFSHRVIGIPKPYPDSQLLLERRGIRRRLLKTGQFLQLNLYTTEFYGLPDELYWDPEINWHHQQLGCKGLVASAGIWIVDSTATISTLQSDLCQQLFRHPRLRQSCKTQVDTHFKYWYVILFNAIVDFCFDYEIAVLYCPTGYQVIANTRKQIKPDLFLRIYDHPRNEYECREVTRGLARYWEIPIQTNARRIAPLRLVQQNIRDEHEGRRLCIFHDIEEDVDTPVSALNCADNLTRMLAIEKEFGISGTYDILGISLDRKQDEIRSANSRHSIAFHSFNHRLEDMRQLQQCRAVDLRVRGYRPPRSRITPELTDYNLTFFNFEWLASSAGSLGRTDCGVQNGIVKIPIRLDDHPLYTGAKQYAEWESELLHVARQHPVFAFGLHDCYASLWLDQYPRLLEKLQMIGAFVTADEICDDILLARASSPGLTEGSQPKRRNSLIERMTRLARSVSHAIKSTSRRAPVDRSAAEPPRSG